MTKSRFRFTKVRDVKSPTRNNPGDAGLDFYMPEDLTRSDLINCNPNVEFSNHTVGEGMISASLSEGKVVDLFIGPKTRVVIPSGIRVLLEPHDSMMQVNNKSGKSTRKGLIFTAQVCDSPYTGEYHIGIYNTSGETQKLTAGDAIIQFVHIPVFLDTPEEMSNAEYEKEAETWGKRGTKGMGSGDREKEEKEAK